IMGHNVCVDLFGGPSPEEAEAGVTVHGDASVVPYSIKTTGDELITGADLPNSQMRFERRLRLDPDGRTVHFTETIDNLSPWDRPIAWTQHVTLGPPFVDRGTTQFRASATKSKVYEADFGDHQYMVPGAEFEWPMVPVVTGGTADLRVYTNAAASTAFTSHLM